MDTKNSGGTGDRIERHYLGIALLCCIIGTIVLTSCGRQTDGALTNLAFAMVGGLASVALPRRDGGPTTTGPVGTAIIGTGTDTTVLNPAPRVQDGLPEPLRSQVASMSSATTATGA